ncbi:MAG: hypothetical protein QOJ54_1871 [Aliidongia sp.]|jgi:hypothetical protein|nr:hypothetical protein [Aliidongia sp.]
MFGSLAPHAIVPSFVHGMIAMRPGMMMPGRMMFLIILRHGSTRTHE